MVQQEPSPKKQREGDRSSAAAAELEFVIRQFDAAASATEAAGQSDLYKVPAPIDFSCFSSWLPTASAPSSEAPKCSVQSGLAALETDKAPRTQICL